VDGIIPPPVMSAFERRASQGGFNLGRGTGRGRMSRENESMTEAAARRAPLWTTAGGICLFAGLAVALGPVLFIVAGTTEAPN
jgi:hypothetical protein